MLFLSGTLARTEGIDLAASRTHTHIARGYLMPAESRKVRYRPVAREARLDHELLCKRIREIYLNNPVPTVVHVTYNTQAIYQHLLNDLRPLINTTKNKAGIQEKFIAEGGIWLASGVSEGIDLPGDHCRQVIVPTLLFPDKGAPFIQKRLGLSDGPYWYKVKTLQNTIQRLGRALRSKDDYCDLWILDPAFSSIYNATKTEFPDLNVDWGEDTSV